MAGFVAALWSPVQMRTPIGPSNTWMGMTGSCHVHSVDCEFDPWRVPPSRLCTILYYKKNAKEGGELLTEAQKNNLKKFDKLITFIIFVYNYKEMKNLINILISLTGRPVNNGVGYSVQPLCVLSSEFK